ncbi:hypothetical protein Taro_039645 [Colocasia esculenta]|uniref:Uncharacterized protein n=1 Tax=Colocasia esculenta TaxID=4460 RepID=A0A843WS40_COLES|nr:hypothetical protein [Colocasia esculenta]
MRRKSPPMMRMNLKRVCLLVHIGRPYDRDRFPVYTGRPGDRHRLPVHAVIPVTGTASPTTPVALPFPSQSPIAADEEGAQLPGHQPC